MHENEVDIDEDLVSRLIAAQFPPLAELPIRAVPSTGTVNVIYRIGNDYCVRLPRVRSYVQALDKELKCLPVLSQYLSLRIPEPVAKGCAASGYPFSWAIYRWIEGRPYEDNLILNECQVARDLAQFVGELRAVDPVGAPKGGRKPLHLLDPATRLAIESARGVIDSDAAAAAWKISLNAPPWNGVPVWIHADLLRPNLLVSGGRLSAVIDFGGAGAGDPAADIIAAWSVFNERGRAAFRRALEVDEGTWKRARGYALHQAALIIPYYVKTNPEFVALAKRTVEQVLVDMNLDKSEDFP